MYQQLWGYKVEEKLYLRVREQKKVEYHWLRQLTVEQPLRLCEENCLCRNTKTVQLLCDRFNEEWSEPGSSVSIVSGYGLDDRGIEVRSPAEANDFFL
jgi:hypothetical protein